MPPRREFLAQWVSAGHTAEGLRVPCVPGGGSCGHSGRPAGGGGSEASSGTRLCSGCSWRPLAVEGTGGVEREEQGAQGTQVTETGLSPSCRFLCSLCPGRRAFPADGTACSSAAFLPRSRGPTLSQGAPHDHSRLTFLSPHSGQRDGSNRNQPPPYSNPHGLPLPREHP